MVVLGGGTGISSVLRGLRDHVTDLAAVVTVADDGGSSGRLRKDYHMLPPGDIRNCLVALSTGDPLLTDLFSYRFEDSILRGHSFGNLFLAVLTKLTGDFRSAVEQARRLLGVKGRVIPSTRTRVVLVASHPDGTRSTGEQCISRGGKPIVSLELQPQPPPVSEEIQAVLAEADLVVLGPGSLFTSLLPNLLVPGMPEAIQGSKGQVVMVANLATQPGETDGFSLEAHVKALQSIGGVRRIDRILVNGAHVSTAVLKRYETAGARALTAGSETEVAGIPLIKRDLVASEDGTLLRHDPERLGRALVGLLSPGGEP